MLIPGFVDDSVCSAGRLEVSLGSKELLFPSGPVLGVEEPEPESFSSLRLRICIDTY